MMNGEVYADFVLFWLLCHQSRLEGEKSEDCRLEKWLRLSHENGIRALDKLRDGVKSAIETLGTGFLRHPMNRVLHDKMRDGLLDTQDYYRQVLRLVYRFIIIFVAEDRQVIFHPLVREQPKIKERYWEYYSMARLRKLAGKRVGTLHNDLYQSLSLVMRLLGSEEGYPQLGLFALNGFLFSDAAMPDLANCQLANQDLLEAIRALAFINENNIRFPVDYQHLGSEELGSVYESLLEFVPVITIGKDATVGEGTFVLQNVSGNERKTTGSYYTPTSLIDCLLDSALEPVLAEACKKADPEQAILDLKVCDPACGSGHFLVAAAYRIAKRLASIRSDEIEPPAEVWRGALRDVIGHCIYGVDINPMTVELCKVSLWMEAIDPGKPLSFLDSHILEGNSLLGTTPALLAKGIPDSAFEPIEGDDKKICSEYRKKNKEQRTKQQFSLFDPTDKPWESLGNLATSMMKMDAIRDDTVQNYHRKQEYYEQFVRSNDYLSGQLLADTWCAAFAWKKNDAFAYPITHEIFRKIEYNPHDIALWMNEEIIRLRKQYKFFHWHLEFPGVFRVPTNDEEAENEQTGLCGGFDVVLSNPPWDRIKLQEKEWFANKNSPIANISNASQRRKMIADLAKVDTKLHAMFLDEIRKSEGQGQFMRVSEHYPLCGRGDVNTYAIFAENMRLILKATGQVGAIIPSGIATDDTTKYFFQNLMETESLVSLYDFENRDEIFKGVHRSYKFCLLTIAGRDRPITEGAKFVFFAHQVEDIQDNQRRFSLSYKDIKLINPNTKTCPIFRFKRDAELNKQIYVNVPILSNEYTKKNPWNTYYMRLIDLSDHAKYLRFPWEERDECWNIPLYEAKLFLSFDHRFATFAGKSRESYTDGQPRELSIEEKINPDLNISPRYFIPAILKQEMFAKYPDYDNSWLLVWRDVARSTDEHTCFATIIPKVLASRTSPALGFDAVNKPTILLTNLNTFILDYLARQKVGGIHLNFSILKQLPILIPEQYALACAWDHNTTIDEWLLPRALELTYTAWDLEPFAKDCGYDGPPFIWDEERRFLLRCELDAAYFHLYGIERNDVDYIMETFPIVKRKDEKLYGNYRTKQIILEMYDEMKRAMETGETYQTWLNPSPADPAVAHPPREEVQA